MIKAEIHPECKREFEKIMKYMHVYLNFHGSVKEKHEQGELTDEVVVSLLEHVHNELEKLGVSK